jgi:hypothetical protein
MWLFTAGQGHRGASQGRVGVLEVLKRQIPTVARIHIEHGQAGTLAGLDADVGLGPVRPPLADLGRVNAGGCGPIL